MDQYICVLLDVGLCCYKNEFWTLNHYQEQNNMRKVWKLCYLLFPLKASFTKVSDLKVSKSNFPNAMFIIFISLEVNFDTIGSP